uniref:Ig-like domain-containing protein n=1 Tax=Labrus bergylta TaxID=56723 RepID=A0A3Q3GTG8_9LABR
SKGTAPTLFPVVQCGSGTGNQITVGCLAHDFIPKSTFQWTDDSGTSLPSVQYSTSVNDNKFTGLTVYTCEVTHKGKLYMKKASKAAVTLALNQPSPKELFNNNQAKLDCIVSGQDRSVVNDMRITWQINEHNVSDAITSTPNSRNGQHSKISTLTRSLSEWQTVNKVRLCYLHVNINPVNEQEEISKGNEVTLVCLVSSLEQQDYYIAWSEYIGQKTGNYYGFHTTKPVENQGSYSAYSQLSLSFEQWNKSDAVFSCVVYHESLTNTTKAIVRSIGSKTSQNINLVNLNMNIPETCKAQ